MGGMSYTDPTSGHVLDVRGRADVHDATVWTTGGSSVLITAQDAPVVAGAILQFAKADATVVPGKLPEVTIDAEHKQAIVDGRGWHLSRANLEVARGQALMFIALTQKLEEYFGSEEYAARRLQERRDELAADRGDVLLYRQLSPWGRRTVDRIIELEDQLGQQMAGTGQ